MDADVVVVGAGLAGLRCALRLTELGREVVVLEADEVAGGRVRTDVVDGFRCDRGFQLLNPAYPAVRRWVDVPALDLQSFAAGVLVRRDNSLQVVADPLREPRLLARTLRSGYAQPGELAAVGRWVSRVLVDPQGVLRQPDLTLAESFDRAGVTGRLRREILDPFLAGVLADSYGQSSANFAKLLVRTFVLGRPGVPRLGMGDFSAQLADRLRRISLNTAVHSLTTDHPGEVRVSSEGLTHRSRAVVVAADPPAAARLTGLVQPETRGLVTWWFDAPQAPSALPLLALDGRRSGPAAPGPVWNTTVMTNAAPSYGPPGRHLVQATCLLDRPDGEASQVEVLRHVGEIYGCDTTGWQTVIRHRIPTALPAMPPPLKARTKVSLGDGVFVCGDHRDTASIQGALVSGQRTAEAVHASLV